MEEKNKKIIQIVLGTILFIIVLIIDKITDFNVYVNFILYMVPYIVVVYDSFIEAIEGFKEKEIFNENFLMIIASFGAMIIGLIPNSDNMFSEGIFVMLFFQVGELFEIIAEGKSEKSINALMDIRPDYANLVAKNDVKKVNPNKVKINDIILVKPGEKVPIDGVVVEGDSSVNTVAVTGESIPRKVTINDDIYSGFININGLIKVKTTKLFEDSTASKIIELVKNASSMKSKSERFISKFSRLYTPIVVSLALFIAIVPSVIFNDYLTWIVRALTFLIVSCPCALVISVPLAYFGGIGGASKKGILFKGSNYLENISKIDTLVFDKTGTLTEGVFEVVAIHPKKMSEHELLHIAAHAESNSTHPIAISLLEHFNKESSLDDGCMLSDVKEVAGLGIEATFNGNKIYVGNYKLMDKINVEIEKCDRVGTILHIATSDEYFGHIVISDKIKKDTKEAIDYFKKIGINTVMLTGDNEEIASDVANTLNIDKHYSLLMPQDKIKKVDELKTDNKLIAFVGDGINDAPVIARSDIGISMGGMGSDAAIEASDVVLMRDNINGLIDAFKISKKTNLIAKENIIFSIFIKFLTLVLAFFGIANMWLAVFADVGVTILAVINSIRILHD